MSNKKQTAVELLRQDIDSELQYGTKMVVNWDMYLAMEKEQIVEHHTWLLSGVMGEEAARIDAEEHYNKTYEN